MNFSHQNKTMLVISFFATIFIYVTLVTLVILYISSKKNIYSNKNIEKDRSTNYYLSVITIPSETYVKKDKTLESIKIVEKITNLSSGAFINNELLSIKKVILETKLYTLNDKTSIMKIKGELAIINNQIKDLMSNSTEKFLLKKDEKKLKKKYIIEFLKFKPNTITRESAIIYLKTKKLDELRSIGFFDNDQFFLEKEIKLKKWFEEIKNKKR